jgi:hypothetical protein
VTLTCVFGASDCRIRILNAEYAVVEEVGVDATMGQLVYLPAGVAGPDPDAFLVTF